MALDWQEKKSMAFNHGIVYTPQFMSIGDADFSFDPEEFFTLFYYAENGRIPKEDKCTLVVSSNGGSAGLGLAIYDYLTESRRWNTYLVGYASSAASIIFLGGQKRYINPHGTIGIHQPQGNGVGLTNDAAAQATNLKNIIGRCAKIYSAHANDKNKYSAEYFKQLMYEHVDELHRYDAKQSVKMGFADAVRAFNYPNIQLTAVPMDDEE